MTPPAASVTSAPFSTHAQHSGEDSSRHAGNDRFAEGRWTSDDADGNPSWSPASYWVRRKRAEAVVDLGA